MAELTTDDEKVEAIKKWWKENGTAVVAGIVIGLVAVFGWRAWVNHKDQVGQSASLAFEQVLMAAGTGQFELAASQAEALTEAHANGVYASLAYLALARVRVEQGDLAGAAEALRAAQASAPIPGLSKLAALRLAHVLIAQGELDAALAAIEAADDGGAFAADFAGLRGDIALAQGQVTEARTAYASALAGGAGLQRLIELKLQDLPATDDQGS
jgi:predicted negative regulator of RcsB-dependent stress response